MNKVISKLPLFARIFVGAPMLFSGLNGFFQFAPLPEVPPAAGAFLGALAATGYMFPMIKSIEILAGIMLLSGRFVPLALILLAPIVVNIAAFHLILTPGETGMSLVIALMLAFLGWSYRSAFRPLFVAKTAPELIAAQPALPESSPVFRAGHGA